MPLTGQGSDEHADASADAMDPPETSPSAQQRWLNPGVGGIGLASFLADVGHEVPTALLPSFVTQTLGAPAAALGLVEGVSEGLAGTGRFVGGAMADDPGRRRAVAVGGYTSTAVFSSLIGVTTAVWQAGVLRGLAWAARGLRVPARNALLADVVPASAAGRPAAFSSSIGTSRGSRVPQSVSVRPGARFSARSPPRGGDPDPAAWPMFRG